MDARTKTLLGGATALTLIVIALPAKSTGNASLESGTPPAAIPAQEPDESPDGVRPLPLVADADAIFEQDTRLIALAWDRDPFAYHPSTSPVIPVEIPEPEEAEEPITDPEPVVPILVFPIVEEPEVAVVPKPPLPRLAGISIRGNDRCALFGRRITREGDVLPSGHTVQAITRNTVTLALDDESITLTLGDER